MTPAELLALIDLHHTETEPEPRLLWAEEDGPIGTPAPMHEGWMVASWYWLIAGRQVLASFAWPVGDDEARDRAMAKAKAELAVYVQMRLFTATHGHLGVVPECGDIPPAAELVGIPEADYDYPGKPPEYPIIAVR